VASGDKLHIFDRELQSLKISETSLEDFKRLTHSARRRARYGVDLITE
jgi:hypothetical protein